MTPSELPKWRMRGGLPGRGPNRWGKEDRVRPQRGPATPVLTAGKPESPLLLALQSEKRVRGRVDLAFVPRPCGWDPSGHALVCPLILVAGLWTCLGKQGLVQLEAGLGDTSMLSPLATGLACALLSASPLAVPLTDPPGSPILPASQAFVSYVTGRKEFF